MLIMAVMALQELVARRFYKRTRSHVTRFAKAT
jgi:hypothetical protein